MKTYVQRVAETTPTRFWINNPSGEELELSLAEGARNGTTNPAYPANLLKREPEFVLPILDDIIASVGDDTEAADIAYQRVTARFMAGFLPLYEESEGRDGLVTMQDDPCRDHSADIIVEAAMRHAKVGANYMAKIPVTGPGMEAMAVLAERNMPICATECFSIAQATAMCELYEEVAGRTGNYPVFYITHITGIYDEEIQHQVERDGIDIAPELVRQAGCIVGRKQYRILKARGYHAAFLGGGARGMQHFTEFVGGDVHITMNWKTIRELNEADAPVVSRIDAQDDPDAIAELREKIPDFRRAYDDDGLIVEEFEDYAPLQRFRNNFIDGCEAVKQAVADRRAELAT
jgi:transaldolase